MYHYVKAGQPFGPVSGQELRSLLEREELAPDDAVRADGETDWSTAADVVGRIRDGELPAAPEPAAAEPASAYTVYTSLSPPAAAADGLALPPLDTGAMRCRGCGTEARDGAAFCRQCGRALPRRQCGECRRGNEPDAVFCDGCGQRLPA